MCVVSVAAAVLRTRKARAIAIRSRRRCWLSTSSVPRCAASSAQQEFLAKRSPCGSKKDAQMRQETPRYLEATLVPAQENEVLELDELWSFVGSKKRAIYLWVALCRRTRQVVAWHFGDRSAACCRMLWNKIPRAYKNAFCFSDLWDAYQKVLPREQHQACGKEQGETNHVERFNGVLRGRIGRLVRRTLSFSKSLFMHLVTLRLFLVLYNSQKAKLHQRSIMAR